MSRALLLAAQFPPVVGGAARRFSEIYRRLPAGSATVVTGWASAAPTSAADGLQIIRLPRRASDRALSTDAALWPFNAALRTVRETVRRRGIERIHCGRTLPEGWLALALHLLDGIPYDCFVFGEEINTVGNGEAGGYLSSRRYRHMSGLVLRHASRLIACSEYGAAVARQQWSIDAERVRVLRPGVDTGFFRPPEPGDAAPPPQWQGRRVVLGASRMERRKGFDVLLRATAGLREQIPDVLLAIAGDGPEARALRSLAGDLGLDEHVAWLGKVSDEQLRACYQSSDVFVLANRQVGCDVEGFGMVLLEAQACGTPVIAGDSGGSREALLDGVTGTVVDCSRPEPLTAALVALLREPARRATMGAAARRWMVEHFDWDRIVGGADWLLDARSVGR